MKENQILVPNVLDAVFNMIPSRDRIIMALFYSGWFEELIQQTKVSPAQTSRLLKSLEKEGLVQRIQEKKARRGKPRTIWKLTRKGLLKSYSAQAAWVAITSFMLETLVEDNVECAFTVLSSYIRVLKKRGAIKFGSLKKFNQLHWGYPVISPSGRVKKIPLVQFNCPIKNPKTPTFVRLCARYPCSQNLIFVSRKNAICLFGGMSKRVCREYIKGLWYDLVFLYLLRTLSTMPYERLEKLYSSASQLPQQLIS
ncbi:MAG: hypothetical protein QXZ02_06485 [Candidatus Bathyarchaeia archaeon]